MINSKKHIVCVAKKYVSAGLSVVISLMSSYTNTRSTLNHHNANELS